MNLSIVLGLGARSVVGGVVPPPLLAPEFRDDFNTDGNMNGRPGLAVETRPAFAGQINTMSASGGKAGGTAGSAAWTLREASVSAVDVTVQIGALGTWLYHFANIAAVDAERDWLNVNFGQPMSVGLQSGIVQLNQVINGGSQASITSLSGARAELADSFKSRFTQVGADWFWTPILNGREVSGPVTLATFTGSFAIKKHGFIGNVSASAVDSLQVADPALQQVLTLYQPNRTAALNPDGSVTWRFRVHCSLEARTSLLASVYDASVSETVPITGLNRVAIENAEVIGDYVYGEITASAAQAASLVTPFIEVVDPFCQTAGGTLIDSISVGPRQSLGYVFAYAGQSLGVSLGSQGLAGAAVAPANSYWIDASPSEPITTRRLLPVTNGTVVASFCEAFTDIAGKPASVIRGGLAGTTIATRGAGSSTQLALLDGIDHAGGFAHLVVWTDGQSDLVTTEAAYTSTIRAARDEIAAANGGDTLILMNPIAAGWKTAGGNDENWQNVRRTQWKLAQIYPTEFKLGAYSSDVQKSDNLHNYGAGDIEHNRRIAHASARALGLASEDRNGPSLFDVVKIDAQTLYWIFDLEGADNIALLNSAYRGEFHGGTLASTSSANNGSTITTKFWPTDAVVDAAPSGGKQGITMTYPPGSFPGDVYAWVAYGKNPFNPNDNGTDTDPVNLDFANRASMIVGQRAGEPNVALQPHFATNGEDWLVAS